MNFINIKNHFINLEEVRNIITVNLRHCLYIVIHFRNPRSDNDYLSIKCEEKEATEVLNRIYKAIPQTKIEEEVF